MASKSATSRPIDQIRESALSMKIGGNADGKITKMVSLHDKMIVVMEHAIYAVQLADSIDPDRTNTSIPNTQQRLLSRGAADPIISKTLLTAHTLFKKDYLAIDFDEQQGLALSLELLKDISTMADMLTALERDQQAAIEQFETESLEGRSLTLPALGNADARCDAFTQKVGHAVDTLRDIARLFYGDALTKKWIDSLAQLAKERYGSESHFTKYLDSVCPYLLLWRDLRNMVEHPKTDFHIKVFDFRLLPTGELVAPSLEIVRPDKEVAQGSLSSFMGQLVESLANVAEALMALFCGAHVRQFPPFDIQVIELPESQRSNPLVRMSYGCVQGNQIIRFG